MRDPGLFSFVLPLGPQSRAKSGSEESLVLLGKNEQTQREDNAGGKQGHDTVAHDIPYA
jgi:hypothetical protein